MGAIASQITSLTIVYSSVYSTADQRKHQSSASLAFVRVIHRGPVNYPHKWPVTRKMFPFDDVIMTNNVRVNVRVSVRKLQFGSVNVNNITNSHLKWVQVTDKSRYIIRCWLTRCWLIISVVVRIHLMTISQEMINISTCILDRIIQITNLRLLSHLPGAQELIRHELPLIPYQ